MVARSFLKFFEAMKQGAERAFAKFTLSVVMDFFV
jgi:hypothetical protein